RRLIVLGSYGSWWVHNVSNGYRRATFSSPDGRPESAALSSNGAFVAMASRSHVHVLNATSGKSHTVIPWPDVQALVFQHARGRGVPTLAGVDGQGRIHQWRGRGAPVDVGSSGLNGIRSMDLHSDGRTLALGDRRGGVEVWDLNSGRQQGNWSLGDTVRALSVAPDGRSVFALSDESHASRLPIGGGSAEQVLSGQEGEIHALLTAGQRQPFAITAGEDKSAHFWWLSSGKNFARLIPLKQGWAVISPEGYFDGALEGKSEDRLDAIIWEVEKTSLPLDGFMESYYRPALLGYLLAGKQVTETPVTRISEELPIPPTVTLVEPSGSSRSSQSPLRVVLELEDQGSGIEKQRLFLNNKVLDAQSAETQVIAASGNTPARWRVTYSVPLVSGENRLKAVGFGKHAIEGAAAEATIHHQPSRPGPKPNIHILTVGINRYKNPDLDLNFGVPDAKGVLEFFTKHSRQLDAPVTPMEIYDNKATKKGILNALESLESTNPEDIVLIYFAGHGDTRKGEWYFIPHDLTVPHRDDYLRRGGISSSILQLMIAKIGAHKVVTIIDACKSGAAVDRFSTFKDQRSFALLSRAAGIHIAAGATAKQNAGELDTLGHGLFTFAILKGLNGDADSRPKNGRITISEVFGFIKEAVPKLSRKHGIPRQNPVINSKGSDFQLLRH
ncbi:MAG: caspase family protein, partial [Magnetococcales bacterium]|nr:caspase family protein [Magnetococcales bacterium]